MMAIKKKSFRQKLRCCVKSPIFFVVFGAVIITLFGGAAVEEIRYKPECSDGIDNDGDGAVDFAALEGYSGNGPFVGDIDCLDAGGETEARMACGDGKCSRKESCSTCYKDCGRCPP